MARAVALMKASPSVGQLLEVSTFLLVVFLPTAITIELLAAFARAGHFAVDFHYSYWTGARDVLRGHSPLPPPRADAPAHASQYPIGPYPAPVPVLFIPFALLPLYIASPLFTGLLVIGLLWSLYVVGVRDWRCYGIVFAWAPVFAGLQAANISVVLTIAIAGIWRFRERPSIAGLVLGVAMALKLFAWPLAVWLVATRRISAAALAFVSAALITVGSWSVVGLSSMLNYPHVLTVYSRYYDRIAYTPFVLFTKLGISDAWSRGAAILMVVLAVAAMIVVARRQQTDDTSFALGVFAALIGTPIIWLHYFCLAMIPLAIFRPRFGLAWILPAALWLCPMAGARTAWQEGLPFLSFGVAFLIATRGRWLGSATWSPRSARGARVVSFLAR